VQTWKTVLLGERAQTENPRGRSIYPIAAPNARPGQCTELFTLRARGSRVLFGVRFLSEQLFWALVQSPEAA
jgi:hypothetical protein